MKEAIKARYEAGVTKPREIMKSLVDDGVIEEGTFPKSKLHNHLQKLKMKMGVEKKFSRAAIDGLEM